MEKPQKPIEPNIKDYPIPKEPTGINHLGIPIYQRLDYVRDYEQWRKDLDKFNTDMEVYEQIKLIRLIKNATEKYCLKTFKINKK